MISLDACPKIELKPTSPKIQQNYAPFISKSPRFNSKKQSQLESNEHVMTLGNSQVTVIKNSSRKHSKNNFKERSQPQPAFKSSTERFDPLSKAENPSPGDY